jgi:hypothetical protein
MKTTVKVGAKITKIESEQVVIEVSIPLVRSMLNGEDVIQAAVNAVGMLGTSELLKTFDTDGSPINICNLNLTSKGLVQKDYETPYGKVSVDRHIYQPASGGEVYCPLDNAARIIRSATPKLAKIISNKYSRSSVDEVKHDLSDNHGRAISRDHIQHISEDVGSIAIEKQFDWNYIPDVTDEVSTVSIGMDGAMMLMRDDGYRQAMSGTIALYNSNGKRLHTNYVAGSPEYGKSQFIKRMTNEIEQIKKRYPKAKYIGIADGASDNWKFLDKHTSIQVTDFYHASEYLTKASEALFNKKQETSRVAWLKQRCHNLKHDANAVATQLNEFAELKDARRLSHANTEKLNAAITYYKNQGHRMDYPAYRSKNMPIGSGVTEAACKTIIKQRMCRSGMRWKEKGASIVLALKCLVQSDRWNQFGTVNISV